MRIYTGILGQIGDIIAFTPAVRRLREVFPDSEITFAVSELYREAGELIAGLSSIDRLFATEQYFGRLAPPLDALWETGWPVDLRGEDEVAEQRLHDLVLETRPRHRRDRWWSAAHLTEELAHMVGIPGPIDPRTEIAIPPGIRVPRGARGRVVLHNDPGIDPRKAWSWDHLRDLVQAVGPQRCVLLGGEGPDVPDVLDLRGKTTLVEAAAVIQAASCFVGIDSGLMWIAGSLHVPTVGLYGTDYIPRPAAVQPANPNATYLTAQGSTSSIGSDTVLNAVLHTCRQ